ncbi:IpaD/SipD/SspD family type III secretion system needle tip protein [Proteus mirabilis]|uniref:IpaD/SipD/SspD family type III secretion system needle tip protein n=1 Tax=Proteus mirabilis TaxID=584 RepID=UPI002349AFFC|nr:IpaD/SipD/SspD family type III secretion system needle tip protein [Proteus mirabilis]MDC5886302.1 IpaD/SipD/SspD family type III secretion system needle tip protein [Proteus mirabilis]MDC5903899.1 IpaD/SipD/SspD family type III secretion system needle tip protein [Proteus mirabilis]MDC5907449.1 IpaD/SipD/SspD family type III secretion system needle tip protein [Proteus mirabilis]MDC5921556.1 IpaD/SipD/SspD family type III secretion system needle tip protein [Proteus mirabilis]MDC5932081.1 
MLDIHVSDFKNQMGDRPLLSLEQNQHQTVPLQNIKTGQLTSLSSAQVLTELNSTGENNEQVELLTKRSTAYCEKIDSCIHQLADENRAARAFYELEQLLDEKGKHPLSRSYADARNALATPSPETLQLLNASGKDSFGSLGDLFNDISYTLTDAKKNYLDFYRESFQKYMEFFREISAYFTRLGEYVEESDDTNKVQLVYKKMVQELEKLHDKYEEEPDNILYKQEMRFTRDGNKYRLVGDNTGKEYSESEALAMMKAFRNKFDNIAVGTTVDISRNIDRDALTLGLTIKLKLDITPVFSALKVVYQLIKGFPDTLGISQVRFNTINTAFDSAKKDLQATLDELSQKYSTANSNYDNFVKILSNTMNAMLDTAKGFLRF